MELIWIGLCLFSFVLSTVTVTGYFFFVRPAATARQMAAVQAAGYQDATTTAFGYVHYMYDRYWWTRLRISGGESLGAFATALIGAS